MLHRIREQLKSKGSLLLKNTVEIDEIYLGGHVRNMSNKKRKELREKDPKGNLMSLKTMVIGMIERGGNLRMEVAGVSNIDKNKTYPIVYDNIDKSAFLMTDGDTIYKGIGAHYAGHESVNHSAQEYVRDGIVHTNTIEGAFGLFRRSIIGIYHKMSPKHLSRYCSEMESRYNSRTLKDGDRFELSLGAIETRLSWKDLTKDNGLTAATIIQPEVPQIINRQGRKNEVYQILNGKIIAKYPSLKDAAKATGIIVTSISKVVRGINRVAGGFQWKYV